MDRKLLATLGAPGNEESGGVVIVREGSEVYEALSGEEVSLKQLAEYIRQAQGYVKNLEEALADLSV